MKAAVYLRVSTEEQSREGYSIAAQLRACQEYCHQRGWEIAGEYVDEGKSAHTDVIARRPAFRALLVAVDERKIDTVVVHKFDRFSRSMAITVEAFRRLSSANCGFVSITEQFDYTTSQGRLFMHMLAALAEFYSMNLSQEVKKGKAERKAQGLYNGLLPFGLVKGPDGLPIRDEQALDNGSTNWQGLLLAFELAAVGQTDAQVARALNARGYRTTGNHGANLWNKNTVRYVLSNRFYVGDLRDGRRNWLPGRCKVFLDVALFEQAQAVRVRHRKRRSLAVGLTRATYALSGFLVCGHCGGNMHISRDRLGNPRVRCGRRIEGHACPQPGLQAAIYNAQVGAWLQRAGAFALDTLELIRSHAWQPEEQDDSERQALEATRARLRELYAWGHLDRASYLSQEAAAARRLAELAPRERRPADELAQWVGGLHDLWRPADDARRNELLHTVVENITIRDNRVVGVKVRPEMRSILPELLDSGSMQQG